MIITANDLKTKGISFFDKILEKTEEVIVSVRGKQKFVLIDIQRYQQIREYELDKAYEETLKDIKDKNFTTDLQSHFKDLDDV